MDITITLSDIETTAVAAERLTDKETLDSVIHRQLVPLVARLISQQFAALRVKYDALPLDDQVAVLSDLQDIADKRGIPISTKVV